ncbi:uncharacterized protein LOC129577424 [Sitodiplosis mosellana]|uniref:uncharacterized protein LOC129577424 n=1 Tax=Sitodiplosis mosellana TaxID=263140 RepID=UPI0024447B19|nr:uncharacterized protein LOC129577424 [Sitodiplosis mosellana]
MWPLQITWTNVKISKLIRTSFASTSNGVVYRYDEQSTLVPMQILTFDAEVTQFLPYLGDNQEFVLFVSMKEGPTKTYQFDGFTFYETPVIFTGGSLGRGVSKMRTHKIIMISGSLLLPIQSIKLMTSLKQPSFIATNRLEMYTMADFLASCGGLWGLFMDVSLLNIIELIYHFSLRLCCTLKQKPSTVATDVLC